MHLMKTIAVLLALLVFTGCSGEPNSASESLPEVRINIDLGHEGFATEEEREAGRTLEDQIEAAGIGLVVDSGSGMGTMNIAVQVRDSQAAITRIQELVAASRFAESSVVRIVEPGA